MNNRKCKLVIPVILAAIVGSQAALAKNTESLEHIKQGCEMLSEDLLRGQNYDNNCAFYINSAGQYLKGAATMMEQEQYKQAILSMLRAEERLRTTELQTEKCGDFSNIAGSYINEVMARKDDLIRFSNGIYH